MTLFYRDLGGAGMPPLLIIHGMLGSSRNWIKAGRSLTELFHVFALDLPNHGRSPVLHQASVPEMADTVLRLMDDLGIRTTSIMGHSLGGKVAMRLAADHPERIERLFVIDVASRAYRVDFGPVDAMMAIDLATTETRAEADAALAGAGLSPNHRQFLLTNLLRRDDGGYEWQVPLQIIRDNLPTWSPYVLDPEDGYLGPTLFIAGGRSDYVRPDDFARALDHFENAELKILPDSGHNVHIDGGAAFVDAVRVALEKE